jgi:hypothetical protein
MPASIQAEPGGEENWPRARFIQGLLFLLAAGTGIEFGGHDSGQNSELEDPSVFAQPQIFFSSTEPDVNTRIE